MPAEGRGGTGRGRELFKILEEMAKWANKSEDKQMWSVNDLAVAALDVFALTSHEKVAQRCLSPSQPLQPLDAADLFDFETY